MMRRSSRVLYENPRIWESGQPDTVRERVSLTVAAVPSDVGTILEVGSGNGQVIDALYEAGYDPIALDISYNALKHINSTKRVQGEANILPFPPNSFDLVLACELLEHIPNSTFGRVLDEISKIAKKHIIITVPFQERLEWNYARCPVCGCIFNGSYHVRSFDDDQLKHLFKGFKCVNLKKIVKVLHPDRTISLELFIRHHLASEYLYCATWVTCPLCFTLVDKRPRRNWIGWVAAGVRYLYRTVSRRKSPLWYLTVYERS